MLVLNLQEIGNRLLDIRKSKGLTQSEVAERSGLSDRAYSDIERGTANMRVETLLGICSALNVTPNDILVKNERHLHADKSKMVERLDLCTESELQTAIELLGVYLNHLNK